MLTNRILAVTAIAAFAAASAQASNPWTASWQLDKVKSAPAGASFIIKTNADGTYQMEAPSQHYKFKCDNGDYVIRGVSSMSCKENGREMDMFFKDEGAQSYRVHRVLSEDGKTMTSETVLHSMPDLAPNNSTTARGLAPSELRKQVYDRMGDGAGFAGAWKEKMVNDGTGPILETTLKAKTFEFNDTNRNQDVTMPLDGKDAEVPSSGRGGSSRSLTMSVQVVDPHVMKITLKSKGKPVVEESLTMSDDTRTLTLELWRPDHPEQKQRKIYNRM